MRNGVIVLGCGILQLLPINTYAQDRNFDPTTLRILNNFAHEHATCVAYYIVTSQCLITNKEPALQQKITEIGAETLRRGQEWTQTAKLKPETFTARVEMDVQQMTSAIENNCSNISIILSKHGIACKTLLEKPEVRIEALTKDTVSRDK